MVVFGDRPLIKLRFSSQYLTSDFLKNRLTTFRRTRDARLDLALAEGKRLFEDSPDPKANKVLVVVMDKRSDSRTSEVVAAAK